MWGIRSVSDRVLLFCRKFKEFREFKEFWDMAWHVVLGAQHRIVFPNFPNFSNLPIFPNLSLHPPPTRVGIYT